MKKLFTLVIVSFLSALAVQAQSLKVTKTDGSVVTYNASDISKIEFLPSETPSQPKLIHEFAGYLTVKNRVLDNARFDTGAKIKVLQDGGKFFAEFSDTQWGTGSFVITMANHAINGTGKMKIANPRAGGAMNEYDATMSGSMTEIKISIPSLMGGTDITWHYAKASAASKVAGTYTGTTSLKISLVPGSFTSATVEYKVTANEDGSINVTASEEKYTGVTMVGNLTLGTYTVKNLAYDKATNSFSRDYSEDGIKVHFKATGGMMERDEDYAFGKTSKMTVTLAEDGTLTITNNYQIGRMPSPISATYTGKKAK
ncbi:calycin-like domain-containing protein [Prevotella jejuni]